ncbi:hypothetical protein O6H91_04G023400 [Diphasiastrum complanatum]|uniref:Uncharacterized protein n=2 Tax=Diphasiastrum complanatum TaxID=34168 RepID=A0ACC2DUT2_DIPCM|nr:hypothetical protein O6H91_04G023400 [Diphasiastrum complanatum]KAJ7558061.1 hypothetical protein O6H91_04G023400 [Diphasiastrum complanatum]
MSRCFPYPPPGYEKKGELFEMKVQPIDPVPSKKKGKHKHHEKKEKKDRRDKKKRRKDTDSNGEVQDKEKHGEAELDGVKHAVRKSSDSAQAMNHHWPASVSDCGQLKNGRVQELESVERAQNNAGRAEQSLKHKEVAVLVAPRHTKNGQVSDHTKSHLVHGSGEDRARDNAGKAEQSSKHKEVAVLVAPRDKKNGKLGDSINENLVHSSGEEPNFGVRLLLDSESCHPILKSVHKEQKVVNGKLNHFKSTISPGPLDIDTEVVQSKLVDSSVNSGSGKKRRSRFKGFLEFAALPQQDDWSADSESWLFPKNHVKDDSKFKVEMEGCTSQVSANGHLLTNHVCANQRKKVELKDENSQVWAEALFLPSVGIHALPYVVPY